METEEEERRDPTEIVRLVVFGVAVVITLWQQWDYISTRVEYMIVRDRLKGWLETGQEKAAQWRRDRGHMLFEAISIVEGTDAGD